jgi:hypothetical protein
MVGIIKFFGWLSVVVAVVLLFISLVAIYFLPVLLPIGASALLGGALLIVFARIVELLEELNEKLGPVHVIAKALETKYRPEPAPSQAANLGSPSHILDHPPPGVSVEKYKGRRVALLSDGSVVGETLAGARKFNSLEEFKDFID